MPTRLYNFFLGLVSLGISRDCYVAQSESLPTSQISNYYSAVNVVASLASFYNKSDAVQRRSLGRIALRKLYLQGLHWSSSCRFSSNMSCVV